MRWVVGFVFVAIGVLYTTFAEPIWRWNIRQAQKPITLSMMRLSGVLFALIGLAVLIFVK